MTNLQKFLLGLGNADDVQALQEAGYIDACFKLTDTGRHYLDFLNLSANITAVVSHAKEKIAEQKAKNQPSA